MSNVSAIEKRFLSSADRLANRENVKLTPEALDALKPIIRGGCMKLDVMGMADDESRVDAAETNLCMFIRSVAKDVKGQSLYKIDADDLEKAMSRGSIWPFS